MAQLKTLFFVLLILLILITVIHLLVPPKPSQKSKFTLEDSHELKGHQCTAAVCGKESGLDPVSDPAYNMKEVAAQSVLLEDHLSQPKKRCRDCICKHFISITSYLKEAVCLAGEKIHEYPYMEESVGFYSALFDEWLNNQWNEEKILYIAGQLRTMRKKIVNEYILKERSSD